MLIKLSASKNPFSWAIRKLTGSPYSHVDIVIQEGFYIGSQPGTGVVLHKEVCDLEHFYEIDIDSSEIWTFLFDQIGKKYDYSGIYGFMTKDRDWQADDSWFCSELVAAALNKSEKLFVADSCRISPGDIARHERLKRVR